ncbi:hypothetical protein MASR1M45_11930 [Candidatus Kapaibacterium sp.]
MIRYQLLLVLLIFNFNAIYSQFLSGKDAQVLVKGKIFEENTLEPLVLSIEFRSQEGKKIKTQSNSNGEFEQLLPSGSKYLVILNSDSILRKEFNFIVDDSDKFIEQKTEWTAIKPKVGSRIFGGNIFLNSSSNLSEQGIESLKELQMLLRFNRSLYVSFEISNKENLYESRLNFLKNYVESWTREKARIEFNKMGKEQSNNDLNVKITKMSDFLNK